jgi:hypothetical protein
MFKLTTDDFKKLIEKSIGDIIDDDLGGNVNLFNNFDQDKRCSILKDKMRTNFIMLYPDEDVDGFMDNVNIYAIVFRPIENDGIGGYTASVDNWGMFGNNEFKGWS